MLKNCVSILALKPSDIEGFFQPVIKQAVALQNAFDKLPPEKRSNTRVPFVTVSYYYKLVIDKDNSIYKEDCRDNFCIYYV